MTEEQEIERIFQAITEAQWQKPRLLPMQTARIAHATMKKIEAEKQAKQVPPQWAVDQYGTG